MIATSMIHVSLRRRSTVIQSEMAVANINTTPLCEHTEHKE